MNETLRALVRMVEGSDPELQVAATQVLGELRPADAAIAKAVARQLDNGEVLQGRFAIQALAKIGTTEAVRTLVGQLAAGGTHVDLAASLLGQMGGSVTKALGSLFEDADSELQGRILEILGRHTDRDALRALLRAVLSSDEGVSAKAAEVLEQQAPSLDEKTGQLLLEGLQKSLTAKASADLEPAPLANALRVLARFEGPAVRATLVRFTAAKNPPIVRQAALQGLRGVPLTQTQADGLLGFMTEGDMTHVVRPTMELLEQVDKWGSGGVQRLKKLLSSRNEELSLFGLRALRSCHTADMAKICMKHLTGGRPAWQEAAGLALGENPAALEGLLRAFQNEKNPERARLFARPLAQLGAHVKDAQIKAWAERAAKLIVAGEPMGDVLLELLLRLNPEQGSRELIDKAVRLRRARKLPECLALLMRLARTEHIDAEGRYQLAVSRLLADQESQRGEKAGQSGDATMGYFTTLVRAGFPLIERLRKETKLKPEALLRLGSHFADGVATERRFGVDLLQFVADKHGRHPAGEDARMALRAEGI